MGENRSTRRATNEVVFRLVNEEIEALNIDVQGSTAAGSMDIVCECEDIACAERLAVTIDAYEHVRASPLLFFVTPGHERQDIEQVALLRVDDLLHLRQLIVAEAFLCQTLQ